MIASFISMLVGVAIGGVFILNQVANRPVNPTPIHENSTRFQPISSDINILPDLFVLERGTLGVKPDGSVDVTIERGTKVDVFKFRGKDTAQQFLFDVPPLGVEGIKWETFSGSAGFNYWLIQAISVSADVKPGIYSGNGFINTGFGRKMRFPLIIRVK